MRKLPRHEIPRANRINPDHTLLYPSLWSFARINPLYYTTNNTNIMKLIELNIGLSSKTLGNINPNEVLNSLTGRGFIIHKYRIQESQCRDGVEKCLAVKCETKEDWQVQLRVLSDRYGQDCIAVVGFIGHSPYDAFCPSLWVEPVPEIDKERLLARWLDAGEKLTDEEANIAYDFYCEQRANKDDGSKPDLEAFKFIGYLEHTLIPDLESDGASATADDFKTLIKHYHNK